MNSVFRGTIQKTAIKISNNYLVFMVTIVQIDCYLVYHLQLQFFSREDLLFKTLPLIKICYFTEPKPLSFSQYFATALIKYNPECGKPSNLPIGQSVSQWPNQWPIVAQLMVHSVLIMQAPSTDTKLNLVQHIRT